MAKIVIIRYAMQIQHLVVAQFVDNMHSPLEGIPYFESYRGADGDCQNRKE
jgi:hypothetical protein